MRVIASVLGVSLLATVGFAQTRASAAGPQVKPACHNGLGQPVACPGDDADICAVSDYVWIKPPGGNCDSPPGPADCIHQGPATASSRPASAAATALPPASRDPRAYREASADDVVNALTADDQGFFKAIQYAVAVDDKAWLVAHMTFPFR